MAGEDFRDFLRDRSQTIESRAREAGLFKHRPTRGVAREDILIEPLREILPPRFGLATGEIRAADGAVSSQWDVVIYDYLNTPKLYEAGGSAVLPIEGVRATISVKSEVTREAVREAAKAAGALRGMPRREIPVNAMTLTTGEPSPAVFLFGFRGPELGTVRDGFVSECNDLGAASLLNGGCVLGSGVVVPQDAQGPAPAVANLTSYEFAEAGDGAFGVFVAFLYAALMMAPLHAPDLVAHIDIGKLAGHIPER